jgi:hypothetical protein
LYTKKYTLRTDLPLPVETGFPPAAATAAGGGVYTNWLNTSAHPQQQHYFAMNNTQTPVTTGEHNQ